MALTQVKTLGIADDAVTEAKVANDAISPTEMKAGTDGHIITYDASGNPTTVGPGTDGQVLTSTGAGSPPAFEDVAALTGSTNNEVVTVTGANAMTGESGLTFDGTHLSITDGNLVIATAGHGIDFSAQTATSATGASMAAELLDHYEEGTFTPILSYWSSGAVAACVVSVAGTATGDYRRIGSMVFISLNFASHQTSTATSHAIIGGLPFAPYGSGARSNTGLAIGLCSPVGIRHTDDGTHANLQNNGNIWLYKNDNGYQNWYSDENIQLTVSGCYAIP